MGGFPIIRFAYHNVLLPPPPPPPCGTLCSRKISINALEKIQRRFTKCISGLHEQPYADRLKSLIVLTLEDRRFCADMLYIFKVLHHKIDCSMANLGLTLLQSSTRANNLNFILRRVTSKLYASLFLHRAVSSWNKLPLNVLKVKSIHSFKQSVYRYFHDCAE